MRGLGETPPLFRLMMPRVTVNAFWMTEPEVFIHRRLRRGQMRDALADAA